MFHLHTCFSNSMITVLVQMLTVAQLLTTFPSFYGTRRFVTVLTSHHWTLLQPDESSLYLHTQFGYHPIYCPFLSFGSSQRLLIGHIRRYPPRL
jgi:hypothetical protein